jgi:hypothetical protein
VLLAGLMGASAALFCGGPVTLGCSFMVVRSSCVCIFWHQWTPRSDVDQIQETLGRSLPG